MARGNGTTVASSDPATTVTTKATRQTGRHAGPWGASFDGTEADGKTPVRGLTFERRWTRPGVHPYDEITWEIRTAGIANESGKTVFEQKDVEVPDFWSQLATNVVVSKYFRGHLGTPERETSVRQLIDRVVNTIAAWAETQHYFATDEDLADLQGRADPPARPPEDGVQLAGLVQRRHRAAAAVLGLLHQLGPGHDVLIMDLAKTEAMLFKFGSGAGATSRTIRVSSKEKMAGGGTASGPVSFMKGYDAFAGVVKSGGKTRRAAKMVILDADHPDILDFIDSQGARGAEGLGAHRGGLRPLVHRRGLRHRLLPERQPLRPGDRRLHARRRAMTATGRPTRSSAGTSRWTPTRPATSSGAWPRPPTSAAIPASSTTPRSTTGTRSQHRAPVRDEPVLRVQLHERHQLQPGVAQPDEVRPRRRRIRRRRLPVRAAG